MNQKLDFVERAALPGSNVSDLCAEFGISRQTGHKWLRRYRVLGYLGLVEESRRPASSPRSLSEVIVRAVLDLRNRHPSWGPDKISRVLRPTLGTQTPSRTTVARLLKRLGKIKRRRPVARIWELQGKPVVEVTASDDLWTIDFKGWWRATNGERCEPFTVRDAFSRFVLSAKMLRHARAEYVRRELQRLFEKYGTPRAIQLDNGAPWICSRSRGGLTKLSAWLVSLGIQLIRSRPAKPQDNGGHERMHRDLAELELSPARSRRAQQVICDRWVVDFNHVRPHDALAGKTPGEVYRPTNRKPIERTPHYGDGYLVRRVNGHGSIKLEGDRVFLSGALPGQLVGLRHEGGLRWRAFFHALDLGEIEVASIDSVLEATAEDL